MTDAAPPPPGWYSGGVSGEERWWDGTRWTEHSRPLVVPRFQFSGSATGSYVAAALCGFLGLVMIVVTLLAVVSSGLIAALLPGLVTLVILGLGGLAVFNAVGLSRHARVQQLRTGAPPQH